MPPEVLVPFDDSDPSRAALAYAFELFPDGDVTALTIVEPAEMHVTPGSLHELNRVEGLEQLFDRDDAEEFVAIARERLASAERIAREHGTAIATEARAGVPSEVIVEHAAEADADHVVMGSHGRSGVSRLLLGSVAERVVRESAVPVTVTR